LLTRAVFDLVEAALDEHAARGSDLRVVPVLVGDQRVHLDLVRVAFRHAGGVLLDADDLADGTSGVEDPTLAAVIRRIVKLPGRSGDIEVEVERSSDGRVTADLVGVADEATNPGFRTVRGVVTSLFDDALRSNELAAIAYDETTLGVDVKQVLWGLMTSQLQPLSLGRVATLLVLVGIGQPDYARHCSGPGSARFMLDSQGFRRRPSWPTDQHAIRESLARRDGHAVLFLGAGFSASSGLPLGNDLRDFAVSGLVGDDGTYSERAERFRMMVSDHGRWIDEDEGRLTPEDFADRLTLERVLREERTHHAPPETMPTLDYFGRGNVRAAGRRGPSVDALGEILHSTDRFPRLVVVTVNFDTLIESVASDGIEVFATEEEFALCPDYLARYFASGGKVPVLKLHGSIDRPDSIVANVDQTMPGLSTLRRAALESIRDSGSQRVPWLYVGYSMRDLDLRPLLGQADFAERLEETWVSPFPDAGAVSFCRPGRVAYWQSIGAREFPARLIGETADVFFRELASSAS
jgi:hypothetical protein